MAISDEERRDIAAGLREAAAHPDVDGDVYCGYLVDCLQLHRGTYRGYLTPESFERLADLVDRPTCRFEPDVNASGMFSMFGTCTRCGAIADPLTAFCSESELKPLNYCPCCGARVIRDDD